MQKNAVMPVVLLAALIFGPALASAEVALDEVVQAGRFVLYRDHADPHKYYYVPDAPRLAVKRDGTPEFTFIKYAKTDGATKGGVIHFLVTWGFSEGELSSAESALRLKDPLAKIAGPVPFKEGTFQVVSATAGEGGLFSRRIVGEGKAPIMPGQKAAVSIALTEEGASLLWESFKNPTSDVSVLFALKFTGITPAFQAKLKVNWDKVYTHHDVRLQAEGTVKVVKLKADMQAILDDLRQKGVIQLDVVGENESAQKMLDAVYTHILNMMCEKVPMGPAGAAPAAPARVPAAAAGLPAVHPARSMDALAEVVRSAGERLRGGPFLEQEQAQAQSGAPSPCDANASARWLLLHNEATALIADRAYLAAAEKYKQAMAACPRPVNLYMIGSCYDRMQDFEQAFTYYGRFVEATADEASEARTNAASRVLILANLRPIYLSAQQKLDQGDWLAAAELFQKYFEATGKVQALFKVGYAYEMLGRETKDIPRIERAIEAYGEFLSCVTSESGSYLLADRSLENNRQSAVQMTDQMRDLIAGLRSGGAVQAPGDTQARAAAAQTARTQSEQATAEERRARREAVQAAQTTARQADQTAVQQAVQTETGKPPGTPAAATQAGGTKPPGTADAGTKPPAGQEPTIAQIEQQLLSGQAGKPPDPTGGTKPAQAAPAAQTPAAKPPAQAPAVQPIVSVQLGYTFKRVKMSGNYEVDMRKRLREDRDIVMSGNISGVFQKYGEDKRFFTVVSLDDPTFQERSVEVILDGQDASDFKSYINSVSVLFRKQRFSGAPVTGEVKFVDQQFAQSGNRQSFKYGRLNEASTEWLDYEYKPKWSLYGGVEWEGEWTKTSDSVLTLSPPVRRRTLEISVDEDNILQNGIKALALQIRHRIYGKDILKEVVINYDKGDPLQAAYTYMHEDGDLGYSYKVVWLLLDGRETHTDWMAKESPFIYAVFTKR